VSEYILSIMMKRVYSSRKLGNFDYDRRLISLSSVVDVNRTWYMKCQPFLIIK